MRSLPKPLHFGQRTNPLNIRSHRGHGPTITQDELRASPVPPHSEHTTTPFPPQRGQVSLYSSSGTFSLRLLLSAPSIGSISTGTFRPQSTPKPPWETRRAVEKSRGPALANQPPGEPERMPRVRQLCDRFSRHENEGLPPWLTTNTPPGVSQFFLIPGDEKDPQSEGKYP